VTVNAFSFDQSAGAAPTTPVAPTDTTTTTQAVTQ
jgi:hypothetical protein